MKSMRVRTQLSRTARRMVLILCCPLAVLLPAIPVSAAAPEKPASIARVRGIHRGLTVRPPHHKPGKGKVHMSLYTKYALGTKKAQRAAVVFKDGTILYMNQLTDALLSNPGSTAVSRGEVDEVLQPGTDHHVVTGAAVASAIGTNFDVRVSGKKSTFIVAQGTLQVKNKGGTVLVNKDQETTVQPNKPPTPPVDVNAQAAIGWTTAVSSTGWKVTTPPGLLLGPQRVALDPVGNLYVSDKGNNRVVKLSPGGKILATWGTPIRKAGDKSLFISPYAVVLDSAGNIYVADEGPSTVVKLSPTGTVLATYGPSGNPTVPGLFICPTGLALDAANDIWVTDSCGSHPISKLSPDGKLLATYGKPGTGNGEFTTPSGIAIDAAGNIYVADTNNNRIQKLSPEGKWLATWGGLDAGKALGQFYGPTDIAFDSHGNIYVADLANSRIQKFAPSGEPLTGLGESGTRAGEFIGASGLAIDAHDDLFVVDSSNGRVEELPGGE